MPPNRSTETRETTSRTASWQPPAMLPDPSPSPGKKYRWIRAASYGEKDPTNVQQRRREGWEPVRAEDHPEIDLGMGGSKSSLIEVGGLVLCANSEENVNARKDYYEQQTRRQMEAVDQGLLRQSHSAMPISKPERTSRVTFGRPRDEQETE